MRLVKFPTAASVKVSGSQRAGNLLVGLNPFALMVQLAQGLGMFAFLMNDLEFEFSDSFFQGNHLVNACACQQRSQLTGLFIRKLEVIIRNSLLDQRPATAALTESLTCVS